MDLTTEQLDKLERELDAMDVARVDIDWPKHKRRALIAMAKRAEQAERERDALRDEHSALIGGMIEILESGYDPADEEQLCPLCRGARNDHKDSECLLAIADRTMLDVAAIRGAALAQSTDAGGE